MLPVSGESLFRTLVNVQHFQQQWGNKVTEGVEQSSGNAYSFSPLAG
jgi:hypothetical protein